MTTSRHTPTARRRFGIHGAFHDYSGVVVLRDVDFELASGQVHALLGENGCGKSTMIKILTGAVKPTGGQIYLDDEPVTFASPARAQAAGIGVVHQNYNVFPDLTVQENVIGTSTDVARRSWLMRSLNHGKIRETVKNLFEQLHIDIEPSTPLRMLGPAERKFVEIARAMTLSPRFLILDEPTASLEPTAARQVLDLMRTLREHRVGVAVVSHRLDEVLEIADLYTVLRDGRLVARGQNVGLDEAALAHLMIGDSGRNERKRQVKDVARPVRVVLRDVQVTATSTPTSFEIYEGEILGVTGLVGSGASSLVQMIGGATRLRGHITVDGREAKISSPRDAQRLGIGYIPEDRKTSGLCMDHSTAQNISLASLPAVSSRGVVSFRRMVERAEDYRKRLDIRLSNVQAPVSSLSGGNQQKVMIAKWLASGIRILAVEEPTQGVDIGGKAQIHNLLREFADAGGTVVLASTDVREVISVADRVAIFRHGEVQEVLGVKELTEAAITARGASDAEHYLTSLVDAEGVDMSEVS